MANLTPNTIGALERAEHQHPYPSTVRSLASALQLNDDERSTLEASIPRRRARSLDARGESSALPYATSSFVGREQEVSAIASLLRRNDVRVVTLTGPGGVGKTALALQVAHESGGDFSDGVMFVALAYISNPSLVIPTVARSVGVLDSGSTQTMEAIFATLQHRHVLVIIDNFEHVTETAPFISEIVRKTSHARFLVTSRARLQISGEFTYPVPPLDLPEEIDSFAPISESEAVRLFVARAQALDPRFDLTPSNASTIAEICRQLDGLPLAIELAAAQTRMLHPENLLPKLSHRLSLLTGGPRDAPDRLRTMRDAIAWSYDLLPPDAESMFRRLAVFVGGAPMESVDSIFLDGDTLNQEVISAISLLLDHGLVHRVETSEGDLRFGMYEVIREFGLEQLVETGEEAATRDAHATYFLNLCANAEDGLSGPDRDRWFARLERDLPNMRGALVWLHRSGQYGHGLQLATALTWFWYLHGHAREGYQWIKSFLKQFPGHDRPLRIKALIAMGSLSLWMGEAREATELTEQALEIARKSDDQRGLALALRGRGHAATHLGDLERAERLLGSSIAMFRELGQTWDIAMALNWFGSTAVAREDYPAAAARFEESESLFLECGDALAANWPRGNGGGLVSLLMGRIEASRGSFAETLAVARAMGDDWWASWCLMGIAFLATVEGNHEQAAHLFGAASMRRDTAGVSLPPAMQPIHEKMISTNRAAMGAASWQPAFDHGRLLSLEDAVIEAEAVVGMNRFPVDGSRIR